MQSKTPLVSIILPCKNEGENVKKTLDSILSTATGMKYEIIVVDDGSQDDGVETVKNDPKYQKVNFLNSNGVGSAKARNFGAEMAKGEYLVFCDAHVFVEAFWLDRLVATFKSPEIGAVCPAIASHDNPAATGYGQLMTEKVQAQWHLNNPKEISPVAVAPGGCIVFRKKVFEEIGGFNKGFRVWGLEDLEISYRTWIMGYSCVVNPHVKVLHVFRQAHPYRVTMEDVNYNLLYMAFVHFKAERIARILDLLKNYPTFSQVLVSAIFSDAWKQRKYYSEVRKRDDDWYMEYFKVNL
ncbi:glycosyltransferase family 2 protein [Zhaonella formicivorans]|uniref:glycosyltransferase family 2 protein n=1 Tax=Zhaonella formicivorans TaxID=2528593 RepID=UPI001D125312|nr:glycosyltransferase [Zhaonella formicivorans]